MDLFVDCTSSAASILRSLTAVRETTLKLWAAIWRPEELIGGCFMLFLIFNLAQRIADELLTKSPSIQPVVDGTSNPDEHNQPIPPMPGAYPTLTDEPHSERRGAMDESFVDLPLEHEQFCCKEDTDNNKNKAGLNDGEGDGGQGRLGATATAKDYDEGIGDRECNNLLLPTQDASEYDADNESSSSDDSDHSFTRILREISLNSGAVKAFRSPFQSNNGEFVGAGADANETTDTHVQLMHDQTQAFSFWGAACNGQCKPSSRSTPLDSPPASAGTFSPHKAVHERIWVWGERQRQQDVEGNKTDREQQPSGDSIEKRAHRWNGERMEWLDREVRSTFQFPTNLPVADILANIIPGLDDIGNNTIRRVPSCMDRLTSVSTTHPTTSQSQDNQAGAIIGDKEFRFRPMEEQGRRKYEVFGKHQLSTFSEHAALLAEPIPQLPFEFSQILFPTNRHIGTNGCDMLIKLPEPRLEQTNNPLRALFILHRKTNAFQT
ncbi:hypothetical protein A1O7_07943 [Cladophialophora yegresii CBS 114405]|uniref:Uncharacterized protein n=1 Tax=Cladophialophora yegresii CBS 114405 TaxID=1182544 RepID=W9VY04_9EURO|nr:uncharacterized protein A1O7_07943 [Cladophialophora yegresii CBS 114405]EXJ57595.1 hypothetical protein A1O7_07943 [Cladophialophora yegresii CBS 114405]